MLATVVRRVVTIERYVAEIRRWLAREPHHFIGSRIYVDDPAVLGYRYAPSSEREVANVQKRRQKVSREDLARVAASIEKRSRNLSVGMPQQRQLPKR